MKRRTLVVERPEALKALLIRELGTTPNATDRLVSKGAVYVDGKRVHEGRLLATGAKVTVVLEEAGVPTASEAEPPTFEFQVVFEDRDVFVVDKPAGLPAQATVGGEPHLLELVSKRFGYRAGLVHRLDRETSGVTIFGKHDESTALLAEAFREGRAKKRYVAVTGPGVPERATMTWPLSKDPSRPGRWRASDRANGIDAHTELTRLYAGEDYSLVSLEPLTGRTHQLRAHLTALGFPIVGDRLYGGPGGPRCLLHAQRLEIAGLLLEAPLPEDMKPYFDRAGVWVST